MTFAQRIFIKVGFFRGYKVKEKSMDSCFISIFRVIIGNKKSLAGIICYYIDRYKKTDDCRFFLTSL
ncbi:hypothetical protein AB894_11860 [Piscirickettsia salmonis]|nr:hypothetical protein AB894_11860 [Piscirickettsia salmonis]